jgi:hypothetical protein
MVCLEITAIRLRANRCAAFSMEAQTNQPGHKAI